jgi:hypothetical protein
MPAHFSKPWRFEELTPARNRNLREKRKQRMFKMPGLNLNVVQGINPASLTRRFQAAVRIEWPENGEIEPGLFFNRSNRRLNPARTHFINRPTVLLAAKTYGSVFYDKLTP